MGTRAITNVVDGENAYYVSMYRQYDGYPYGGHGQELAEFLTTDAHIGNGIRMGGVAPGFFNGVSDLAARLVAYFNDANEPGSFYLYPPSEDNDEEFTYTIIGNNPDWRAIETVPGSVRVIVTNWDKTIFDGPVAEYVEWANKPYDFDDDDDEG